MSGMSDYSAQSTLDWETGRAGDRQPLSSAVHHRADIRWARVDPRFQAAPMRASRSRGRR